MSKFITFEWRCKDCDTKYDAMVKPDVREHACPRCGGDSKRLISTPRFDPKMGLDPDFSTFGDKWVKTNKQKTAQDKAFYEKHGVDKKHHSYGS